MSNLLNIDTVSKGRVTDPSFIVLANNVKKYSNLFRNRIADQNRFIPKDHILYKVLLELGLQPYMDDEFLHYRIRDKAKQLATSFRFTYYNSFGELSHGNFIPDTKEVLILTTDKEGPITRILYHNHFNLNFELGEKNFHDGLAFIELNIYALAKAYFKWVKERGENDTTHKFLYMEGVYRLLPEYMDLALINRHFYNLEEIDLLMESKNKEFATPHIGESVTTHINTIEKFYTSRDFDIGGFLDNIPCVFKETALSYVPTIPSWGTDQIRWAYELARLLFINSSLHYLMKRELGKKEKNHLYQFQRFVKNFNQSRQLSRIKKEDRTYLSPIINETDLLLSKLL